MLAHSLFHSLICWFTYSLFCHLCSLICSLPGPLMTWLTRFIIFLFTGSLTYWLIEILPYSLKWVHSITGSLTDCLSHSLDNLMAHLLTGSLSYLHSDHLHIVTHSLAGSPSHCLDHLLAHPLTQITYFLPPPQVDHCRIQLQTQSLLNSLTRLLTVSHSHLFIGISTWVSQWVTMNPTHYLLVHSLAQPVTG